MPPFDVDDEPQTRWVELFDAALAVGVVLACGFLLGIMAV